MLIILSYLLHCRCTTTHCYSDTQSTLGATWLQNYIHCYTNNTHRYTVTVTLTTTLLYQFQGPLHWNTCYTNYKTPSLLHYYTDHYTIAPIITHCHSNIIGYATLLDKLHWLLHYYVYNTDWLLTTNTNYTDCYTNTNTLLYRLLHYCVNNTDYHTTTLNTLTTALLSILTTNRQHQPLLQHHWRLLCYSDYYINDTDYYIATQTALLHQIHWPTLH